MLAFFVEVDSLLAPGVEIGDQLKLLARPGVKWMSDSEMSIQTARIRRSRRPKPRGAWSAILGRLKIGW